MAQYSRLIQLAKNLAAKSEHPQHRMSSILFKKNRIISFGINKLATHPKSNHPWKNIHAEFHCIVGVGVNDLVDAEIFVYRERRCGGPGLAKPCKSCDEMLRKLGLKKVHYSTDTNSIASYEF